MKAIFVKIVFDPDILITIYSYEVNAQRLADFFGDSVELAAALVGEVWDAVVKGTGFGIYLGLVNITVADEDYVFSMIFQ